MNHNRVSIMIFSWGTSGFQECYPVNITLDSLTICLDKKYLKH